MNASVFRILGCYVFAISTFLIDLHKTESTIKKQLPGAELSLSLPHPRLAEFDEYPMNSYVFNKAQ
jgi:hypothetical protein